MLIMTKKYSILFQFRSLSRGDSDFKDKHRQNIDNKLKNEKYYNQSEFT